VFESSFQQEVDTAGVVLFFAVLFSGTLLSISLATFCLLQARDMFVDYDAV